MEIALNTLWYQKALELRTPKDFLKSNANIKTYPADCRKIAAVDSNKHDWDWEYIEKKRFLYKNIFIPFRFLTSIFYTDSVHFELLCLATDVQIHF